MKSGSKTITQGRSRKKYEVADLELSTLPKFVERHDEDDSMNVDYEAF
jgi:hypothetical protein